MKVRVGTSGFGLAKAGYARSFPCVEVQHTFYQPPRLSTLERWRAEMPASFEFTIKAWQLITHDAKSPTYRRLKKKLTEKEKAEAGYFRPTGIVSEAWDTTLASAKALKAKMILFQCPASFRQTKENIANLEKFFSNINRGRLQFGWEPRGDWDRKVVKSLCTDLKLWHVVDPFVAKTVTPARCYFRLHGKKGWRYEYQEEELGELALMVPEKKISYVFFNNVSMTRDAMKFQELLVAQTSVCDALS